MIIEPRVRGFICTTAHPVGCATNVREQIAYVLKQGPIADCPKRVAVLGCSTGYGLASRIVATFAGGADTIGVSLEREPSEKRSASAGWYNNRAFEIEAEKIGRSPLTLEGDAFSDEMKKDFIERVREKFGQLDLLVYSMAAPVRTDPDTGKTYRSVIKPLGAPVEIKTLDTETGEVFQTTLEPANEEQTAATVAVMGGDDWKRWINQLADAGVLAPGFRTLNYTYIGSELTWPIYWNGTLGRAKVDLDSKAQAIRGRLGADAARVVALKAVVTQASSAIPVVPLYGTVLFKVMKQLGLHEGCIEQIDRLFDKRCLTVFKVKTQISQSLGVAIADPALQTGMGLLFAFYMLALPLGIFFLFFVFAPMLLLSALGPTISVRSGAGGESPIITASIFSK